MQPIIGTPIFNVNRYSNEIHRDNIGMSIGSRVREARKSAKMTQAHLAKKVGMSQGALSELETGESISTSLVASLAAALEVNALWLETGKGPAEPADVHTRPAKDRAARMILAFEEEAALLDLFRRSDDRGRFEIIKLATREADRNTKD